MHTDRLFAHSPLIWMVATVIEEHDRLDALRKLPVTTMASRAYEEHLCVHVQSRSKVSLLRSAAQWCLVTT